MPARSCSVGHTRKDDARKGPCPSGRQAGGIVEIKDKLSLGISVLALLVSVAVFVDDQLDARRAAADERERNSFVAYRLGDRFAIFLVAYVQTTVGEPAEIESFRESILYSLQEPQGYADRLELRLDLGKLLRGYDSSSPFTNRIHGVLSDRLETLHEERVAAAFEGAFWSTWLAMNAEISEDKGNGAWLLEETTHTLVPELQAAGETLGLSEVPDPAVSSLQDLKAFASGYREALKRRFLIDS
jgi:hypothetical protein